jgi:hypothetical protein
LLADRVHFLRVSPLSPIGFWKIPGLARRWFTQGYDKLPPGALVSDATTMRWLGLTDKGWFCEEPHYKGSLLH